MYLRSLSLCIFASLSLLSCQQAEVGPTKVADEGVILAKAIIGGDDRIKTTNLPSSLRNYRLQVGQLITEYQEDSTSYNSSVCSASLIQESYIITAAHCAFNEDGEVHKNQFFYPGITKRDTTPYGKYQVEKVFMPKDYTPGKVDSRNDIAIMKLAKNQYGRTAGSHVSYFSYWTKEKYPEGDVLTIGYPTDKSEYGQYFENNCQSENRYYDNQIQLNCDVMKGQSGSPILIYSQEYKDYHIHGVISSESRSVNYGSRISPERYYIIASITSGKFNSPEYNEKNFSEKWKVLNSPKTDKIHVSFKNNCSRRDLFIAVNYKSENGEWTIHGYYRLAPFSEKELIRTTNTIFYAQAIRENGVRHTSRDLNKYLPAQKEDIALEKFQINEYGHKTYSFDCN